MCLLVNSRRPLPGGMAAHWCFMSRAQAVWRTGSTKMSALLSLSMFSTSYRRSGGGGEMGKDKNETIRRNISKGGREEKKGLEEGSVHFSSM